MIKLLFLTILFTLNHAKSQEICSRVATINYQSVIVDTSSNKKGEGLRFYLQKDSEALALLDEYQQKSKPSALSTTISTAGSVFILAGLASSKRNSTSSYLNRNNLIYGGLFLVGISYLTTKNIQSNNEVILKKAIDQYNKRNTPKIFFNPIDTDGNLGVGMGVSQEF